MSLRTHTVLCPSETWATWPTQHSQIQRQVLHCTSRICMGKGRALRRLIHGPNGVEFSKHGRVRTHCARIQRDITWLTIACSTPYTRSVARWIFATKLPSIPPNLCSRTARETTQTPPERHRKTILHCTLAATERRRWLFVAHDKILCASKIPRRLTATQPRRRRDPAYERTALAM